MKSLAILAAAGVVAAAGSLHASASGSPTTSARTVAGWTSPHTRLGLFPHSRLLRGSASWVAPLLSQTLVRPAQTGSGSPTATPAPTNTPGPATPTPTATSTYPDATQLLQLAQAAYGTIRSAHIQLITTAEKPKIEKLTITGTGDATCKGPAFKLNVKATDLAEAANTKQSIKVSFVQVKKTTEARVTSSKNSTWVKVKDPNNTTYFGNLYSVDNPLACPTTATTSGNPSGGGGFVPGTPVNLGPETFQGIAVWHVQQPVTVQLDAQGDTANLQIDYLIGQDHPIPYVLEQTQNDEQDGIIFTAKQVTTKLGEKVKTIKLPKLGSK